MFAINKFTFTIFQHTKRRIWAKGKS